MMKFVISKGGVKRSLETPFALCIDAEHFADLIKAMQFAHAGMVASGISYGWVRIDTSHPDPDGPLNTPPMEWSKV
jgi:hypothetical protein